MPFNKIIAESMDLTDTYAFTGTVSGAGGGKIGQVINATHSTEASTTSTSHSDTGLTANITPSATSSKILIMAKIPCGCNRNNAESYMNLDIVRGSTNIWVMGSQAFGGYTAGTGSLHNHSIQTLLYVDSPSTTSQTTYKITFAVQPDGNAITQYQSTPSTLTLMEVLA